MATAWTTTAVKPPPFSTPHHHHHQRPTISHPPLLIKASSSSSSAAPPTTISAAPTQQRIGIRIRPTTTLVACSVALKSDDAATEEEDAELSRARIGARVRVKAPQLKVYHIPKVPEMDIAGMEGELKQYVNVWKGKRISANFPFKVQFFTEIEGRGSVKFFVHLREDEFEYVQ